MLPFRPAAPGNCVSPPVIRAAPGSASAALQRLSAFRVVEMSQPQPSGYFSHYYPSPYGKLDTRCLHCHQPSGVVWSVNPVSGVRPQMYPVDTAREAPADPSTRIEPLTPANSPIPAPYQAASVDQTAVNNIETEVEANDVGESLRDGTAAKADGRRPTTKNATKVSGGARKVRKRLIFNAEQLKVIRHRFDIDPYIGRFEACGIARELGVPTKPLLTWFANERRRVKAADLLATSEHP